MCPQFHKDSNLLNRFAFVHKQTFTLRTDFELKDLRFTDSFRHYDHVQVGATQTALLVSSVLLIIH